MVSPVVLALAVAACGGSSSNTATAPTATTRCAVALRSDAPSVTADGGAGTLTITVNRECPWEASADVTWMTVTTARAGQGNATVSYTVASNPQPQVRRGQLIVNDSRVEITQAGAACSLTLDTSVGTVGSGGGSLRVAVAGLSGCPWTVVSQVPWIRVASGGSGDGGGAVTLDVAANDGQPRTGGVVIAGQVYTVVQDAAPLPPAPPGAGCAYAVQPSTLVVAAAGGAASVNVATGATCSWTVATTAAWLTVAGPPARQGPTGLSITVAPNPNTAVRTGTLVVAGQTVLVVQDAAAPLTPPVTTPPAPPGTNCSYSVAPPAQPIAASGGGTILNVTAPAGCAWSATSTVDWLLVIGGASGQGSGTVSISSAANPGTSARTGSVVVAGQSIPVTQAGTAEPTPPCTLNVAPTTRSIGATGGPGEVTVTASAPACTWAATSNAPWVTVTSGAQGTGGGVVNYQVAPNETQSARSGTLTVAGRTVSITQDAAAPVGCSYQLSPSSVAVDAAGGEAATRLQTAAQCSWTATSQVDWLTVVSGTNGTGAADVRVLVAANTSTSPRTGTVVIAGQALQVVQAGATAPPPPPPPPPPPTCTFSVSPSSQNVDAAGGAGQVAIGASDNSCVWTAQSGAAWISLTSAAQGTGNGAVGYQVAPNETTAARSGTLTVAGQSITISQAGAAVPPPPACTYQLSPATLTVDAAGGNAAARLETQPGCTWMAVSQASWITLASGAGGTGSADIVVTVQRNATTSSRMGTVTVANQTLQITQAGAEEMMTLQGNAAMVSGACPNVTFRIMGQNVVADAATAYEGGTCSTLRNGLTVGVEGRRQADGSVLATRIRVVP